MSRLFIAASFGIGMLCSGVALEQNTMTAPNNSSGNETNPAVQQRINPANQPGLASTTSDPGNMGTGASSAAIGTGGAEKGMNSPETPGLAGAQGETGANPDNPGGQPKSGS